MKYIKLTQGKRALVDNEDFEWLNQWRWTYLSGYAVRHQQKKEYGNNSRKMVKMHRVINKTPIDLYTDHCNQNRLDNRKINLRTATNSQNQANVKLLNNINGYRGVCKYIHNYNEKKPWAARIKVKGKGVFKGMFYSKEEAALAYNELAIKYFGEFANLNQIRRII